MKTLKFKFIAVAFASFILTAQTVSAQAVRTSYSVKAEDPFAVKYLGNDGDYLLFEISVISAESRTAMLGVSDKTEGELFAQNFKADKKVQKLKIEKRDNQELSFRLVIGKNTYTKSFTVNNTQTENTVVAENAVTTL